MERVPVEIWQQILLKAMEMDSAHIFATTCTPYTFLYFLTMQTHVDKHWKFYFDYLERRRRLRLVCRAWSEFLLLTRHRWLHLDNRSTVYDLLSTAPGAGRVRTVEKLSTIVSLEELVTPMLSWASHILKRSANQAPLRAYTLRLLKTPTRGYNPFEDLVGTGMAPEYTNTTLRSLSITTVFGSHASIGLSQISSTFTGLRSLSLINTIATPAQAMVLPHLEVLYLRSALSTLQRSMQTWDTPALRHVHLGYFSTPEEFTGVLDGFLGRYARQIESLALWELSTLTIDLPPIFWSQFSALRLLGVLAVTLEHEGWSGWTVVPPAMHPLRYLVCWSASSAERTVGRVRPRWTWHNGVRLVAEPSTTDTYHIVKDVRDDQWIAKMEETNGILPEL
jgi:hypothetical protein